MHQDIINKLKANEKPFGLMGPELRKAMKKLPRDDVLQFCGVDGWQKLVITDGFGACVVYKLRPDYEPEPKVIRCEIFEKEGHLHFFKSHDGMRHSIGQACDQANFAGFEFDMLDNETHSEAWLNLDLEYNGNHKWTHASHVRFSK